MKGAEILAKHNVKCVFCNQIFDANVEPYIKVSNGRRYAHQACAAAAEKKEVQEKNNLEILEDYIKYLYHTDTLDPKISKQIQKLVNMQNSKYNYSGIQRDLKYFYEVKKNDWKKDNPNKGVGIVPYIYKESCEYWAKMLNKQKDILVMIEHQMKKWHDAPTIQPGIKKKEKKKFEMPWEEIEASADE